MERKILINCRKAMLSITVACLLAMGSGYITLMPDVLDRENKALDLEHKLEIKTGKEFNKETECSTYGVDQLQCNHVMEHYSSVSRYMELNIFFLNILFYTFVTTVLLGVLGSLLHLKDTDNPRTRTESETDTTTITKTSTNTISD